MVDDNVLKTAQPEHLTEWCNKVILIIRFLYIFGKLLAWMAGASVDFEEHILRKASDLIDGVQVGKQYSSKGDGGSWRIHFKNDFVFKVAGFSFNGKIIVYIWLS